MNSHTVYQELSTATNVSAKKSEDPGEYCIRLCQAISELSDEDYEKFSKAADEWFRAAASAINDEKLEDIPELVGFPGDDSGAAEPKEKSTVTKKEKPMRLLMKEIYL